MNKTDKDQNHFVLIGLAVVLVFLIVCPIAAIFAKAVIMDGRLDLYHAWNILRNTENVTMIGNSFLLGVLVVLSTVIAAPLAYLFSRTKFAKYKVYDIIFMIPLYDAAVYRVDGLDPFYAEKGAFAAASPGSRRMRKDILFPGWTGARYESACVSVYADDAEKCHAEHSLQSGRDRSGVWSRIRGEGAQNHSTATEWKLCDRRALFFRNIDVADQSAGLWTCTGQFHLGALCGAVHGEHQRDKRPEKQRVPCGHIGGDLCGAVRAFYNERASGVEPGGGT